MTDTTEALLVVTLEVAVPLWIEELRHQPWDEITRIARECGEVVAGEGDVVLYRSKRKGASAKAFNALAQGLACLAFAPGGVRFLGLHWDAKQG